MLDVSPKEEGLQVPLLRGDLQARVFQILLRSFPSAGDKYDVNFTQIIVRTR